MTSSKLHDRSAQVAELIGSVMPSANEVVERIRDIATSADPLSALDERRAVTSIAARLHAASTCLLGLLGEHSLTLADGDDLAAGLAERGVFLPPRRCFFRGRK